MESFIKYRYVILYFLFFLIISRTCNGGNLYYNYKNINGLHLKYIFGFWLTSKAATGDFYVKKIGENRYVAKLIGETTGVVGFFLNYRKDTMISEMVYSKKLHRFIPVKFIKQVIINKDLKESTYIFDYKHLKILKLRKKIIHEKSESSGENEFLNNGLSNPEKILKKHYRYYIPLEKKVYDDYLTAAVNFITGCYGQFIKGKPLLIRLFPEKSRKKRHRVIKVYLISKNKNFIKIKADLNVDFISDKIRKVFSTISKKMIPESVEIPTGTIIGTLHAERIKVGEK